MQIDDVEVLLCDVYLQQAVAGKKKNFIKPKAFII